MFDFSPLAFPCAIIFLYFLAKRDEKRAKKIKEMQDLIKRQENGETIYVDEVKYLTKQELKKYLGAKFYD